MWKVAWPVISDALSVPLCAFQLRLMKDLPAVKCMLAYCFDQHIIYNVHVMIREHIYDSIRIRIRSFFLRAYTRTFLTITDYLFHSARGEWERFKNEKGNASVTVRG